MEKNFRRITAVLGPTNTGKTHLAVETMLEHQSGIIGFPLRLLAREVFDKCVKKVGAEKVALITGEEKIIPKSPKYYICTVESMPKDMIVEFIAVDEIQMCEQSWSRESSSDYWRRKNNTKIPEILRLYCGIYASRSNS